MKTLIKVKPCFYCKLTIDLAVDDYIRIDTLQSILEKGPRAYAHELCDAQANEEIEHDNALSEYQELRDYQFNFYGEDY